MEHTHAVVWIDHHEAHIIHFDLVDADAATLKPSKPHRHLHHKRGSTGAGHEQPDNEYLDAVAKSLADAGEILIAGPAGAKLELKDRLDVKHADIARRVAGVETVDHPSEGELLKFARAFFRPYDRMRGM